MASNWNLAQIGVATGLPVGGANLAVVAIMDTGVDPGHPGLTGRLYPLIDVVGEDLMAWGAKTLDFTGRDGNGHGTHVAGLVAAASRGSGTAVLAVKVIPHGGVGDDARLTEGIERALAWQDSSGNRVRVLNLSVASARPSARLITVIRRAVAQGVLVVAASGNDGGPVEFPATMAEVMTVGATGADDKVTSYSGHGAAVDIVAPGGSETKPIVSTWPTYLTSTDLELGVGTPHAQAVLVGTSMAAPQVSAAAAALWSAEPGLTAAQVRARLLATAEVGGRTGQDPRYGFGRLDVARALRSTGHDPR